jgi:hypothetical protein
MQEIWLTIYDFSFSIYIHSVFGPLSFRPKNINSYFNYKLKKIVHEFFSKKNSHSHPCFETCILLGDGSSVSSPITLCSTLNFIKSDKVSLLLEFHKVILKRFPIKIYIYFYQASGQRSVWDYKDVPSFRAIIYNRTDNYGVYFQICDIIGLTPFFFLKIVIYFFFLLFFFHKKSRKRNILNIICFLNLLIKNIYSTFFHTNFTCVAQLKITKKKEQINKFYFNTKIIH